jgi:putative ubiquitin-RnfH superfamily antitoxin RatB of RatAB toxin-antitoxin module
MNIEVVYIAHNCEFLVCIEVLEGATVEQAIKQSGLLEKHPDIAFDKNEVGIFGELVSLETILKKGDRVEVNRPLTMDPMQARRLKAKV